jgi:hypothetical protein
VDAEALIEAVVVGEEVEEVAAAAVVTEVMIKGLQNKL